MEWLSGNDDDKNDYKIVANYFTRVTKTRKNARLQHLILFVITYTFGGPPNWIGIENLNSALSIRLTKYYIETPYSNCNVASYMTHQNFHFANIGLGCKNIEKNTINTNIHSLCVRTYFIYYIPIFCRYRFSLPNTRDMKNSEPN